MVTSLSLITAARGTLGLYKQLSEMMYVPEVHIYEMVALFAQSIIVFMEGETSQHKPGTSQTIAIWVVY